MSALKVLQVKKIGDIFFAKHLLCVEGVQENLKNNQFKFKFFCYPKHGKSPRHLYKFVHE